MVILAEIKHFFFSIFKELYPAENPASIEVLP